MFLTNDQKAAIGGEGAFHFSSHVGVGDVPVDCLLSYEYDAEGIYNTTVEHINYQGVDIMSCLDEAQINEIEMDGLAQYEEAKQREGEY
jgi:hypothetical protein